MRMNLGSMPSPNKVYTVDFQKLDGGLNIDELDYRLKPNESPEMRNLWWEDGVLQGRDGQVALCGTETEGTAYACYGGTYHGFSVYHFGTDIYAFDHDAVTPALTKVSGVANVPENAGTFFQYGDHLYYKNKGAFLRFTYHVSPRSLTGEDMLDVAGTDADAPIILINTDPATGAGTTYQPENRLSPKKTVWYNASGGTAYKLPVIAQSVTQVLVNGAATSAWSYDSATGIVTFDAAPPVTNPPTNNTVRITYSLPNADALSSLMSCDRATVMGEGQNLCILLAGCDAQPNAVFWNANDELSMQDSYFPITNYNLCGVTEERVTGFGRQYNDLIVFKEKSLGKLEFSVERIDGRDSISFTYQTINPVVGCDLPGSIQLIDNNLVFANRRQGVFILTAMSAAYENNATMISKKVNGDVGRGLLLDIRREAPVCSIDDNRRYWLVANGHAYVWDYEESTRSDPSWYYFTGIVGAVLLRDEENSVFEMSENGVALQFRRVFADQLTYGEAPEVIAIDKLYKFPVQHFGTYERLKDVVKAIFEVRSDTNTTVSIEYETDYENRFDLTPISSFSWRLVPRDLRLRCLRVSRFAYVAKRNPKCRHIRHFTAILRNNVAGQDLALVSAQIYYNYQGRQR